MLNPQAPILIAGPTASGKSALALALAERLGGIVINADSMQVYAALPILTAQPSAAEQARVPHRLYGTVPPAAAFSVAQWLDAIAAVLAEAADTGQTPIIVGGTGLYFHALLDGLSHVPEIPTAIRAHWRQLGTELSGPELHAELAARDAVMAARLVPSDRHRLIRALEVVTATGRSLAFWQEQPTIPLIAREHCIRLLVAPERDVLRARCDQRFDAMLAAGALAEVAEFAARLVPDNVPILGALGLAPLLEHRRGALTLAEAADQAKAATRQYAKRQVTWARRYMQDWRTVNQSELTALDILVI